MDWNRVAEQRRRPGSLLRHVQHLLRARRMAPEFGWGASALIENGPPEVFAHRCEWENEAVVAVHNLSGHAVDVDLDLDAPEVEDLLEVRDHAVRDGRLPLRLDAYGHHWLRLLRQ
jgi:glycosidase